MSAQPIRDQLPDWPRLMREPMAAAYLGIGTTKLRELDLDPRKIGHCTVYDRRDLDAYADRLAGRLDIPTGDEPPAPSAQGNEVDDYFAQQEQNRDRHSCHP